MRCKPIDLMVCVTLSALAACLVGCSDDDGNNGTGPTGPDTTAPVVVITHPQDYAWTNQATDTIRWTVDGVAHDTTVALVEGLNTFIRSATDTNGTGADTVHIRRDTQAPAVVIASPADGSTTYLASVPVVWTVDGVAQTTQTSQALGIGLNTIVRSGVDSAGNRGADTVRVTRDTGSGLTRLDSLSTPSQNTAVVELDEGYTAALATNSMAADSEYLYTTPSRVLTSDTIAFRLQTVGWGNGGLRLRFASEATVGTFSFGSGGNAMYWISPDGMRFTLVSGTGWITQANTGSGSRLQGKGQCTVQNGTTTITVYFKFDFRIP